MNTKQNNVRMIRDLSDAFGPPGFEEAVLGVIRRHGEGLGTFAEDPMRNLYLRRAENTGDRPVLMLDAHSDEVGFMIHSVNPDGTLRFVTLGGWSSAVLASTRVLVRNADGTLLPGIVTVRRAPSADPAKRKALPEIQEMAIDVGAVSRDEALGAFRIRIGEPAAPETSFHFDEAHGLMFGKAFDCRLGCAALIETLRRLQGCPLPFDVVGVFSAQEELGMRGCRVAVERVRPQIAFCFEGSPADDTAIRTWEAQTALRRGPMFRFLDQSVICSPRFQRYVLHLAEKAGIPAQGAVRENGGNDAAVINTACGGVPVVVAGIPVRYTHTGNGMACYDDFEATVRLAVETLKSLQPDDLTSL